MVLVPPVEHTVVDSLRIEEAWAPSSRQGPALLVLMSPSFSKCSPVGPSCSPLTRQPMPAAAATAAAAPDVGGASQDALVPEGECRSLKGAR